jgi:hypothetical protein
VSFRGVHGENLPGADRRYWYVHYRDMSQSQVRRIASLYPDKVDHLPYEEYYYPVRQNGTLVKARRYIPYERAQELWEAHVAREVLES